MDWDRIDALLHRALEVPPSERAAFIARAAADAGEAAEVASLLEAHERSGPFLTPAEPPGRQTAPVLRPGARVGAYELVREVGRGGMGAVFYARRVDGTVAHDAAVKLIDRAPTDGDAVRRFTTERALLASLRHPNIVTFLDGGTTADGVPYLITEFVDGVAVTTYVRERRASLEARLRLFRQICAGVQTAHRNGIVHCDLKPSNILVTGDGLPKILDFGIAKLLGRDGADLTQPHGLTGPLTPNYASPEQLRGRPVTTSSDVYALGVLLYELLTGSRPRETDGRPFDEVIGDLDRPITRPSVAARRRTDLPFPPAVLAGDIDAVVAKALRDDPNERYASADELSADVGRALDGLPVAAREPSLPYVLSKLVSRHRAVATTAGLALVAILTALGLALWQWREAQAAQARAEARFQDVRTLANALIFRLDQVMRTESPTEARRVLVTEALTYLDRLSAATDDPQLALELGAAYQRVADIQGGGNANLGDLAGAESSLERALAVFSRVEATPRARRDALQGQAQAQTALAAVLTRSPNRRAEAKAAALAALEAARRWVESDRTDLSRRALASAHFAFATQSDDLAVKRTALEAALREFDALLQERPDDPDRMRNVALVDKNLVDVALETGDPDGARRHAQRAADLDEHRLVRRPNGRQERLDAAISLAQLATVLPEGDEKRRHHERSLGLREAVLREDPADRFARMLVRRSRSQVAWLRARTGDADGARQAALGALDLFAREDVQALPDGERRWAALAHATLAHVDARQAPSNRACGELRQAHALASGIPSALAEAFRPALAAAQTALPGCPVPEAMTSGSLGR